jgi:hypothetical protein
VEEFEPRDNKVNMYVCGITPYSESHLGHAMSYVIFDTLRRYLEFKGYEVRHVQNYTDIDDKLIARAEREGIAMHEVAERYIREFEQDTAALNIQPAHVYPRASASVTSWAPPKKRATSGFRTRRPSCPRRGRCIAVPGPATTRSSGDWRVKTSTTVTWTWSRPLTYASRSRQPPLL